MVLHEAAVSAVHRGDGGALTESTPAKVVNEPNHEMAQLLLAVIATAVLGVHVVHGAHLEWEQHSTGAVQAAAMVYRPVYRPLHARDIRRLIRG